MHGWFCAELYLCLATTCQTRPATAKNWRKVVALPVLTTGTLAKFIMTPCDAAVQPSLDFRLRGGGGWDQIKQVTFGNEPQACETVPNKWRESAPENSRGSGRSVWKHPY